MIRQTAASVAVLADIRQPSLGERAVWLALTVTLDIEGTGPAPLET